MEIGDKCSVRPERILTEEQTVRVLARLRDPNLLVIETALATGARISEILGLTWGNVDLQRGIIHIVQRNWRGDIGAPKSKTSKRFLTLGHLDERFRCRAAEENAQPEKLVFVRTDGTGLPCGTLASGKHSSEQPLRKAAIFPGLGPHSVSVR